MTQSAMWAFGLWQAKTHRQVIFVIHNANLVISGDAELVVCCDYRTTAARVRWSD